MKVKIILLFVLFSFLLISCGKIQMEHKADIVLRNGTIITLEDSIPTAQALAIKDGKIIFVGSNQDVGKFISSTTNIIDLNEKFVMPGFNDSHAHFLGLGESLLNLDLRNAKNWNEVISIVDNAVKNSKPGEWIIGRGWHQEKFSPAPNPSVNGYPIHNELSKVSPNNPVMLSHASGHAIFVNEYAMKLAGITKQTKNPEGGTIVKDKDGNPIGVFEENAENLIRKFYDDYLSKRTEEEKLEHLKKIIKLAGEECLRKGITSCSDAGLTFNEIDALKKITDENLLPVRLNVMIGDSYENLKKNLSNYKLIGYGNNFLTVRSIKQYIDGALGSRGAWLLKPYNDLPNSTGSNVTPINQLKNISELAIQNDFQMRIHAIGDRGNREVLNLYESIFKKYPDKKDLRWCIEHAQHLSKDDIPRFSKLGVIAAMQSVHCTSDMNFVPIRLGNERAEEGAYVWRKLIDSGAIISNGTDAPVEDINPIESFYSAVTRKNKEGKSFFPEQKMTRIEALKSYTLNGAYVSFEEKIKGTIKKDKLADIVVLSNNILTCDEEKIPETKVLYTILNGKIVYGSK
ncbi:MAG: amidohydrolase [Melioribacteraceae bacterium]|nr:amidohydrolase [Melioribacteraceae bacterium]